MTGERRWKLWRYVKSTGVIGPWTIGDPPAPPFAAGWRIEEVEVIPVTALEEFKERLKADGAEAMARREYELHQEDMGYETVWEEESEGHRNIWLDAANERLVIALSAAEEPLPGSGGER